MHDKWCRELTKHNHKELQRSRTGVSMHSSDKMLCSDVRIVPSPRLFEVPSGRMRLSVSHVGDGVVSGVVPVHEISIISGCLLSADSESSQLPFAPRV